MKLSLANFLHSFTYDEHPDLFASAKKHQIQVDTITLADHAITRYSGEFWTARQRQASSLHEVSYRACFKAELPRFFIALLTKEEDVVYDPFSGRGTTAIEAGLHNRNVISNDINPLSEILSIPRFSIPNLDLVRERLKLLKVNPKCKAEIDLSMFYHQKTEAEIVSLQRYLLDRKKNGKEDEIDRWIRMVATNRLTGHSKGFFSVYTLPPNQAVSPERQLKINKKLKQKPEYRDVRELILKKSKSLIHKLTAHQITSLRRAGEHSVFLTLDARHTTPIKKASVQLTVTSPPFLNIVSYHTDNWLRCWFNGIDDQEIGKHITASRTVEHWSEIMESVFKELFRITKTGGWVAFEVGDLKGGKINLDEHVVPLGLHAGFECQGILINAQKFTKTSNIWGIHNNHHGTNTNRIVLFHKR
ncbi:MAG: DNA methyltransferase [bacterium]